MTDWLSRYDDLVRGRRLGIRQFVVEIDAEDVRVVLSISDRESHGSEIAVMRFSGVAELRFQQVWDGFPLGIQIVSIADRGVEGLEYKVTDPEHDIVSFLCADLLIEIEE
jgi:hypothetical protein